MAGQTLKVRNVDLSGEIFDPVVSRIEFINRLFSDATATFAASQFDNVQIADDVVIKGNLGVNRIVVNGGSIDASAWLFEDWTPGKDSVRFNGSGAVDTMIGTSQDDVIVGGGDADEITFSLGADTLLGGKGDDDFIVTDEDNIIQGTRLNGGKGDGDAIRIALSGDAFVFLRDIDISGVEKVIFESPGNLFFSASQVGAAAGKIHHFVGSDVQNQVEIGVDGVFDMSKIVLTNWGDNDVVQFTGSNRKDRITGSAFTDVFLSSKGKDVLNGGGGLDVFILASTDVANGKVMRGGGSDDFYNLGSPSLKGLTIDGGAGNGDTIDIDPSFSGNVSADFLKAKIDNVEILGFGAPVGPDSFSSIKLKSSQIGGANDFNTIVKGFNDGTAQLFIFGNSSDISDVTFVGWKQTDEVLLQGGQKGDLLKTADIVASLFGRGGNDTLQGGSENDLLGGGRGADILRGGGGKDTFFYLDVKDSLRDDGSDIIEDFQATEIINLQAIDANSKNGSADDAFSFIGTGVFNKVGGELRFEQKVSQGITIVFADVDGDGKADMEIELTGLVNLSEDNFVL